MMSKTIFLVTLIVKTISCQRLVQPYNYPQVYSESVIERYSGSPQLPPMSTPENDVLCKNLANAIQNVIFERFSQSCLRKPMFGPMAGPLINDIKNSLCQCPACSSVNLSPNGYSKSLISPNAVSNIMKSTISNTIPGSYSMGKPNVSVNRKYTDLLAVLGGFGCDCGCRGPVMV